MKVFYYTYVAQNSSFKSRLRFEKPNPQLPNSYPIILLIVSQKLYSCFLKHCSTPMNSRLFLISMKKFAWIHLLNPKCIYRSPPTYHHRITLRRLTTNKKKAGYSNWLTSQFGTLRQHIRINWKSYVKVLIKYELDSSAISANMHLCMKLFYEERESFLYYIFSI